MQSVSVVMWRKFDSLTDSTGFAKWACVIARYEILKFKRARARDRFQFDEELISLILEEGAEELPARTARLAHLEACLEKLPESRKALVLQAYAERGQKCLSLPAPLRRTGSTV
jgi:RNA polymerase sigma-70 factor (ECF subfamily)